MNYQPYREKVVNNWSVERSNLLNNHEEKEAGRTSQQTACSQQEA
jgi:hypothetical protein